MTEGSRDESPIVWVAGTGWDGVEGTDRRLCRALADQGDDIVWIDHPMPTRRIWSLFRGAGRRVGTRIRVEPLLVTPAFSRALIRWITLALTVHRTRDVVGETTRAIVVASPLARFPPRRDGVRRIFFMTDDWLAGATLMGLSRKHLQSNIYANLADADAVVVVSPGLEEQVRAWAAAASPRREPAPIFVIPNGAPPAGIPRKSSSTHHALLVGQINARTDLTLLHAVLDASVPITVVGPLTEVDPRFRQEWASLSTHPLMTWVGPCPASDVADYVSAASVGLVPYSLSSFNLASSPLKTLEYLAGGLPVVSSALPSSTLLAGAAVTVTDTAEDFAVAVSRAVQTETPAELESVARQVAAENSWASRARAMHAVITAS